MEAPRFAAVHKLASEFLFHCLFVALSGEADQPSKCERRLTLSTDFNRYLIREPPTRRLFTSTAGFTFSRAFLKLEGLFLHALFDI